MFIKHLSKHTHGSNSAKLGNVMQDCFIESENNESNKRSDRFGYFVKTTSREINNIMFNT